MLEEILEDQTGELIVARFNVDENQETADTCIVQLIQSAGAFAGSDLVTSTPEGRPKAAIIDQLTEFLR